VLYLLLYGKGAEMKEYDITLMIGSRALDLAEIENIVNSIPLSGSYNKGDIRGRKKSKMTWFSLFSCKSLSVIPCEKASRLIKIFENWAKRHGHSSAYDILLDIAVFSDQEATSFIVPADVVEWAAKHKMGIEISTYICNMEN
jgi:hypothetical protein